LPIVSCCRQYCRKIFPAICNFDGPSKRTFTTQEENAEKASVRLVENVPDGHDSMCRHQPTLNRNSQRSDVVGKGRNSQILANMVVMRRNASCLEAFTPAGMKATSRQKPYTTPHKISSPQARKIY